MLILSVLIYGIRQFFCQYYRQQRESDLLHLQNRLATESWEQVESHLQPVNGLKHEIVRHYNAVQDPSEHGYGLWTVKRIVERYDGIVNAEYDEATFRLHWRSRIAEAAHFRQGRV